MHHLKASEIHLLESAQSDGRIPFPQGSTSKIDRQMHALVRMEKAGLLRRGFKDKCLQGFYLTEKGRQIQGSHQKPHGAAPSHNGAA